jgi:hypothetical protein
MFINLRLPRLVTVAKALLNLCQSVPADQGRDVGHRYGRERRDGLRRE